MPLKGNAQEDLVWFIGLLVVLGIVWVFVGGPKKFNPNDKLLRSGPPPVAEFGDKNSSTTSSASNPNSDDNKTTGSNTTRTPTPKTSSVVLGAASSTYWGKIKINTSGTRVTNSNLDQEYVTLEYRSRQGDPINITGWKLENGKENRTTLVGSRLVKGVSDLVSIPQGTRLLWGNKPSTLSDIVMNPGSKTYVVTGRVSVESPYKVDASFLPNKCSGYIANLPNYKFYPSLSTKCPLLKDDVDLDSLEPTCRDFVSRLGRCHTPVVKWDNEKGELIDGKVLPSYCANLVKTRVNYADCLKTHQTDEDFLLSDWRVFLRARGFELWVKSNETITLYDRLGKIVDQVHY